MNPRPEKLTLQDERTLVIAWSDGITLAYRVGELRKQCPCATCREKRQSPANSDQNLLPVLGPAELQPLRITAMEPVGQYAYSIHFSDGHDTGIYTLESLREVGTPVGS
ncbi:MAG: DUF971 domain-containing protein [Pirellulaceae bacterium]|nr:DUF971 domain-containing protein [Planctomycetales bacterium]